MSNEQIDFIDRNNFFGFIDSMGQWSFNGSIIYNTNTGYVGIGNNTPSTLLYVAKIMTVPTITVRNLEGTGGATYTMTDDASGANWKLKPLYQVVLKSGTMLIV